METVYIVRTIYGFEYHTAAASSVAAMRKWQESNRERCPSTVVAAKARVVALSAK